MQQKTKFKLTFLGTGTSMGIPVIGSEHEVCLSKDFKDKRLRTSVFIESPSETFLIDCGPDFRQQALKNSIQKVDYLLITHEHNDHVLGLDELRPLMFKNNHIIPIFGLERTLNEIKKRFPYAFSTSNYPGVPKFQLEPIKENQEFKFEDVEIQSLAVQHGNLQVLGYQFNDLVYITDANFLSEETIEKIKNCKILIVNSLHNEESHYSHFVLKESLKIIERVKPQIAYLTHIGHKMGFHEKVQEQLPKNVFLAYDNLTIFF
jgi:phosphoribosyl 1,2-cyclic phosphate phosphodiesterase